VHCPSPTRPRGHWASKLPYCSFRRPSSEVSIDHLVLKARTNSALCASALLRLRRAYPLIDSSRLPSAYHFLLLSSHCHISPADCIFLGATAVCLKRHSLSFHRAVCSISARYAPPNYSEVSCPDVIIQFAQLVLRPSYVSKHQLIRATLQRAMRHATSVSSLFHLPTCLRSTSIQIP
jgi:hypothetical protein